MARLICDVPTQIPKGARIPKRRNSRPPFTLAEFHVFPPKRQIPKGMKRAMVPHESGRGFVETLVPEMTDDELWNFVQNLNASEVRRLRKMLWDPDADPPSLKHEHRPFLGLGPAEAFLSLNAVRNLYVWSLRALDTSDGSVPGVADSLARILANRGDRDGTHDSTVKAHRTVAGFVSAALSGKAQRRETRARAIVCAFLGGQGFRLKDMDKRVYQKVRDVT